MSEPRLVTVHGRSKGYSSCEAPAVLYAFRQVNEDHVILIACCDKEECQKSALRTAGYIPAGWGGRGFVSINNVCPACEVEVAVSSDAIRWRARASCGCTTIDDYEHDLQQAARNRVKKLWREKTQTKGSR